MSLSFATGTKQAVWELEVLFERDLSELGLKEKDIDWVTVHVLDPPSDLDAYRLVPDDWTYVSHRARLVDMEDIMNEDEDYTYDPDSMPGGSDFDLWDNEDTDWFGHS